MELLIRIGLFAAGLWLLNFTFISVVRTFVVPRNEKVALTRFVFGWMRFFFEMIMLPSRSYFYWDKVMALFAPLSLLALSATGIALIFTSYWAMFTGLGIPWNSACALSGSFLLTLGSASIHNLSINMLGFSESVIGLVMVALLISFLPTIYTAFSKREVMVTRLEFRAGSPPSGVEIIARHYRLSHEQYQLACLKLSNQGVPLKKDQDQTWIDFRKCKALYDGALLALATLTLAPEGAWSHNNPVNRKKLWLSRWKTQ